LPTALALWFLRRSETLWRAVSIGAVVFAGAGLAAVLLPLVTKSPFWLASLTGIAQLLGVPLWLGAFALFALLAPSAPARRKPWIAAGLELAVAICAAVHWLTPRPPF
jgi:hypothetical protein